MRLKLPAGYGALLLGGDISGDKSGLVAQRFVARSGGTNARLVVLAAGYAKTANAQADAKAYAAAFQPAVTTPVQWFVLDSHADQAAITGAIGSDRCVPDCARSVAGQDALELRARSRRAAVGLAGRKDADGRQCRRRCAGPADDRRHAAAIRYRRPGRRLGPEISASMA